MPTPPGSDLRSAFPVLADRAYLNAGTDGPIATRAVAAARAELERELADGRTAAHFMRRAELAERLRTAYAGVLGAAPADLALTTCTSDGIARVLAGMPLAPGDEILTSDEEHPGLLGPLGATRELRGVTVRSVPLTRIAEAVGPRTRLVACSHVSWVTGALAPAELAQLDVPVLLDGAQGAGAVPVDVGALGCAAYAAAGQKWLCGPDGTGMLYLAPEFGEQVAATGPGYVNFEDAEAGVLHAGARRHDTFSLPAEATAMALAAHDVLAEAGWAAVHERAAALAAQLAAALAGIGREVAPRGPTTLVVFASPDPAGERERLAERGVVVRDLPGTPHLRASVGAWNDERDLERLLAALAGD